MKVLVPDNVELKMPAGSGVSYVSYDPARPVPGEHGDAEVLVAWGNAPGTLADAAERLPRLKLVQSLAAGADDVVKAGFPEGVRLASGRGLHDDTVAEHALALSLTAVRRIHLMRDAQRERRWPGELGGIQPDRPPGVITTLDDANVTVWGFGGIARRLAPLLQQLGARVTGVARSAREEAGIAVHTADNLAGLLPQTDLLVLILPSTQKTRHMVNAGALGLLPAHAWVINVGRGDTVDEADLVQALEQRRIAGAALDVFENEPLPAESPLWGLANVVISPHAAGGRPRGAERLINKNLEHLTSNAPLINEIDPERGF